MICNRGLKLRCLLPDFMQLGAEMEFGYAYNARRAEEPAQ